MSRVEELEAALFEAGSAALALLNAALNAALEAVP